MSEAALLALQRCLVELALEPREAEPAALAAARGLPARDVAAFARFRSRLLHYRGSMRDAIWEPMEIYFPLTQALLEDGEAWQDCKSAFLATRSLVSPFYRDIASTFLGWLASSGWGQDRWPGLLPLAHFELVKELVEHFPDGEPPGDLHPHPAPGDRVVLAPPTQVLAYGHRVHEATWERPEPPPGPCHLLASRDGEGLIRWRVLTETSARLLKAEAPIARAAAALGLEDLPATLAFLEELREAGAVSGFREEP